MSRIIFYVIAITIIAGSSCKKSGSTAQPNPNTIKVVEYKTKTPLSGVTITLYLCSKYDAVFGCQKTAVFATHTTDANGEYPFTDADLNKATEGIVLSKSQYWNIGGGSGEVPMEPEATANLTLHAANSYPDTSIFELKTTSELGLTSLQSFTAPADSVVNYKLFGNEANAISWRVYTKDLACTFGCIETVLASGSLSLSPGKFESVTGTIDY